MNSLIMIVEDQKTISNNIRVYLEKNNYKVIQAYDGLSALDLFYEYTPDLIILDLMIPKLMGEEVCRKIRESSNVPIVMLTAKSSEDSMIEGIDIGADDYLTKPFSMRELITRINSIFRRINNFKNDNFIEYNNGDLKINFVSHIVLKNNVECSLTNTEKEILFTLSKFPKKVFSREELISFIIGDDYDGYNRAIDSHIKNLRHKIESDSSNPKYIITVRGVGYRFGE